MLPLKIEGLSKDYGPLRAVDDVSFEVRPGEIFGLLGPNGAGKTSIISCIVTLEAATSGNIEVFSHQVHKRQRAAKRLTGFMPQEIIHHGFFTVEELLVFHSGYYGIWNNRERIDYLLESLGLYEHRKKRVKQLSGGMRRRLLIAKALVHKPKLLLLDEPTAGVDIELRATLWEFVRTLQREGISILLTTHYLEEAERLCDRVGILNHGKLLKVGPTKNLIAEFTCRKIVLSLRGEGVALKSPYLMGQEENQATFNLPNNIPVGDLIAELGLDLHQIKDLSIREGSLEDAFLKVVSHHE